MSLTTGLNYYKTVDEGSKKMGEIDNDTYSLSLGLTHQAHTLTASWQQVNGNEYFDYLHETNGIYLPTPCCRTSTARTRNRYSLPTC